MKKKYLTLLLITLSLKAYSFEILKNLQIQDKAVDYDKKIEEIEFCAKDTGEALANRTDSNIILKNESLFFTTISDKKRTIGMIAPDGNYYSIDPKSLPFNGSLAFRVGEKSFNIIKQGNRIEFVEPKNAPMDTVKISLKRENSKKIIPKILTANIQKMAEKIDNNPNYKDEIALGVTLSVCSKMYSEIKAEKMVKSMTNAIKTINEKILDAARSPASFGGSGVITGGGGEEDERSSSHGSISQ